METRKRALQHNIMIMMITVSKIVLMIEDVRGRSAEALRKVDPWKLIPSKLSAHRQKIFADFVEQVQPCARSSEVRGWYGTWKLDWKPKPQATYTEASLLCLKAETRGSYTSRGSQRKGPAEGFPYFHPYKHE